MPVRACLTAGVDCIRSGGVGSGKQPWPKEAGDDRGVRPAEEHPHHPGFAGDARDLLHVEEPYESAAGTALLAAREYLMQFGGELGISEPELSNLSLAPESTPIDAGVEYRYDQEKSQFDTTSVVFAQTYFGLPVWEAGVAVHMRQRPFVVLSAQSTRHVKIDAAKPRDRALTRIGKLEPGTLAATLGVAPSGGQRGKQRGKAQAARPTIQRQRLVVYQYDERKRTAPEERPPADRESLGPPAPRPTLPLPPVDTNVEDGKHYVAAEIIFTLSWIDFEDLVWRALLDVDTLTVLYLRALVDDVTGLVFKEDPVTANGGPLPDATIAALNPLRTSVVLPDLSPPVAGTYSLTGDRVELQDVEVPTVPAPTSPAGTAFDFAARTDNFAAVNAYYHCDRFFQLVEELRIRPEHRISPGRSSRRWSITAAVSAPRRDWRSTHTASATAHSGSRVRHSCWPT